MENLVKMTEAQAKLETQEEKEQDDHDPNALYSKLLHGEDMTEDDDDESVEYSFDDGISEQNEAGETLQLYKSPLSEQSSVTLVKQSLEVLHERDPEQLQGIMEAVSEDLQARLKKAIESV